MTGGDGRRRRQHGRRFSPSRGRGSVGHPSAGPGADAAFTLSAGVGAEERSGLAGSGAVGSSSMMPKPAMDAKMNRATAPKKENRSNPAFPTFGRVSALEDQIRAILDRSGVPRPSWVVTEPTARNRMNARVRPAQTSAFPLLAAPVSTPSFGRCELVNAPPASGRPRTMDSLLSAFTARPRARLVRFYQFG